MKRLLLLGFAVASMNGIGQCAETPLEDKSPKVPQTHWAYKALSAIARAARVENSYFTSDRVSTVVTRYEFAVAIARAIKIASFQAPHPRDWDERTYFLERRDALMALRREFATELSDLGVLSEKRVSAQSPVAISLGVSEEDGAQLPMLPLGHWIYDALEVLTRNRRTYPKDALMTRPQAASITVEVLNTLEASGVEQFLAPRKIYRGEFRDAVIALRKELAPELVHLTPKNGWPDSDRFFLHWDRYGPSKADSTTILQ